MTGGSGGIGQAVAESLAAEGVSVVIGARGQDALESAAAEIAALGARIVPLVVDTSDDVSVRSFITKAVGALGRGRHPRQ